MWSTTTTRVTGEAEQCSTGDLEQPQGVSHRQLLIQGDVIHLV